MSKKVVIALSIIAVVLGGVSVGLWWTVNTRIDKAQHSLAALSEFSPNASFESRLQAPAKAVAELKRVRTESTQKDEDIASKTAQISSLDRKLKDSEANVAELETKRADLTRERDDAQGKVDGLGTKVTAAESRVKDLESQIAKQVEDFAKEKDTMEKQVSTDKNSLITEVDRTRQFYAQLYNFAVGKGLNLPLSQRPWDAEAASGTGPKFVGKTYVAEVVGFDARQGVVILNVGPDSGITRDQGFNLVVGDVVVAKVAISEVLNSSMSSATFTAGSPVPQLKVGTAVKLVTFSAPAAAPAPAVAPAAK